MKSMLGLKKFILGSTFDTNWKGRGNSVLLGNFLSNYNEFIKQKTQWLEKKGGGQIVISMFLLKDVEKNFKDDCR